MGKRLTSYGIMGGTFDPIHYGHLVAAEEAYVQFKLDRIIFIPSGRPPHKEKRKITSSEDRYLMAVMATASNPQFEVSRLEIDRPGPSYAIDTVKILRKIYGTTTEIYFITGADAILEILTWKEAESLCEMCRFIAATRPGYSLEKFKQLYKSPQGKVLERNKARVYFMEVPTLAISSTDLRKRVYEGRPIKYLLPESVLNYIYKNGLYKNLEEIGSSHG